MDGGYTGNRYLLLIRITGQLKKRRLVLEARKYPPPLENEV